MAGTSTTHLVELMDFPQTPDSDYEELHFPEVPTEFRGQFAHQFSVVEEGTGGHPYRHVYRPCVGFDNVRRNVYVAREQTTAAIIKVERSYSGNIISPHVYTVELKHGNVTWTIQRRYVHFLNLHRQLQVYRATLKIPIPTKSHRERRSFRDVAKQVQTLPKFPIKPESLVASESMTRRSEQLERYLNAVLRNDMFCNYGETLTFLEISHLSFVSSLGPKRKEGMIKKRSGDERVSQGCQAICYPARSLCSSWQKRWLILRDTFLAVIRPKDGWTREVMLMDSKFDIQVGLYRTGRSSGIAMINQSRKLTVSSSSQEKTADWLDQIKLVMSTTAADFIQPNRFGSFAPIRHNVPAQWYVDGEGYMKAVARALEEAREEIFITDWMLNAELFLIRPIVDGDKWRLDKILQRKAEEGVKIFILLYKEVELALSINSDYTRKRLQELHPENIMVLRHPDHVPSGVMLWAHHEKMVVIDQTYAFLGGLDLCFGRWDNYRHRLVDLGDMCNAQENCGPGFERSSFTVTSLTSVLQNVALSTLISLPEEQRTEVAAASAISGGIGIVRNVSSSALPRVLDVSKKIWPGKDYMNFIYKDFQELDSPFTDLVDRTRVVRMPWHDIGMAVQGSSARDVARHFIQRWNATKHEKAKEHSCYPLLMPKSYENLDNIPPLVSRMRPVSCQILRSVCRWSAGVADNECSIHDAYVHVISEAKHFVYIENQFFISLTGSNSYVHNKIADAIFERILKAHKNKEIFRVYVVMPLLPAFEGELGTNTGISLQAITHWNYSSMSRGPNSLYGRLGKEVGDPTQYLTFYGLRTFEEGLGKPVTELVYVHSKMLIADDLVAIIGSANINDRSMRGDRDSEIAVIVEDADTHPSRMADQPFNSGSFVGSLRRHIFREHLGLIDKVRHDIDLSDPVCDKFFKGVWLTTASRNTKIFEQVFSCVPNDSIHTFQQLRQFLKEVPLNESNVEEARNRLKDVNGQLVLMPLQFLSQETLSPPVGSKESLMPTVLWT